MQDEPAADAGPASAAIKDDSTRNEHPFEQLRPELLLDMVERLGLPVDGRLTTLPSYENRVYEVGLWDQTPVIIKIYRPERWSTAQILEEHAFLAELANEEIPAVAPLVFDGATLHTDRGFRWAAWPRRMGRAPEVDDLEGLERIGRTLGRIHAVGARAPFTTRETLDVASLGSNARSSVLASPWLPAEFRQPWADVAAEALERIGRALAGCATQRLHGDFHLGNVLWRDDDLAIVDFDDARTGPCVQDLWMMLAGEDDERRMQWNALLRGYELFRDFDDATFALIEPLRTLRLLLHSAWIASRWDDPAFPPAFPWFGRADYWSDQLATLRLQLSLMP